MTIRATLTVTGPLAVRVDDASVVGLRGTRIIAIDGVVAVAEQGDLAILTDVEALLKRLGIDARISVVALS